MICSTARLRSWCLSLIIVFCLQSTAIASEDIASEKSPTIAETVIHDYKRFYSSERFMRIGIGCGSAALLANTELDRQIQEWYQEDVRSSNTDDFSRTAKLFGEGKYLIPLSLLLASTKYFDKEAPVGNWAAYSTRAYIAGVPSLLLVQRLTGGSRPGETTHDSRWRPFNDNNGVSGHSFIGAVPFLALAKMNRDNTVLKYVAYAASAAAAWSRVNDNGHYLSQAALGWYMAWESVDAVVDGEEEREKISIAPIIGRNTYGIAVSVQW
jgi:hypothetical protein